MRFDTPDPSWTASPQARANFRLAVVLALAFVALLWVLQLANAALDVPPLGIRPRTLEGLAGVLVAPLSHAGLGHLASNTVPLVVLLVAMLHIYPQATPVVLPWLYLGPGLAVWAFGRDALHAGASGLVYGLTAYVFVAGLLRRDRRAIAASLAVAFLYGYTVWGVLPIRRGDSWETHLAGAALGVLLALLLRRRDVPPKVVYSYEAEERDDDRSADATAHGVATDDYSSSARAPASHSPASTSTPS
jgi:membrane associated rhomboid family serine protease